jgi:hypothetical protein
MYSNKELKTLLQSKKKKAKALNKRAMKGGNIEVLKQYRKDMTQLNNEIQDARDENRDDDLNILQNEKSRLKSKIAMIERKMGMMGGSCCGGNVGRKRNKVMVQDNTQKIFSGVFDTKKNNMTRTPINLRGGSYSLPVGDIISNEQHKGIVEAQNKYANAWRRRNQYVKF